MKLQKKGGTLLSSLYVFCLSAIAADINYDPAVTDYAPVISAAIDAAEPGSTITLGEGVFPIAGSVAVNNITLEGAANGGTIMDVGPYVRVKNAPAPFVVNNGGSLVRLAITGCKLEVTETGGAVLINSGTLAYCSITNNWLNNGNSHGGGVYVNGTDKNATVTITHCRICDNGTDCTKKAGASGGGLYVAGLGTFRMDNCLIAGNKVTVNSSYDGSGGGLWIGYSGDAIIANCTFADNSSNNTGKGGGIYIDSGKPQFVNCIIAQNTTFNDSCIHAPDVSAKTLTGSNEIDASLLNDNTSNNLVSFGAVVFGSDGIAADPGFAADGDYHLKAGSPAIGKGVSVDWMVDKSDLDGVERSGAMDLGCFSFVKSSELSVTVTLGSAVAFVDESVDIAIEVHNAPEGKTLALRTYAVDGEVSREIDASEGSAVIGLPGTWNVLVEVMDGETVLARETSATAVKVGMRKLFVTSNAEAAPEFPYDSQQKAATNLADVTAYCVDGTEIELDSGTHTLNSTIKLTDGVCLYGQGRDSTWINAGRNNAFSVGSAGFTLENLSVTNFATASAGALELKAGGTVRNCRFAKNFARRSSVNTEGMAVRAVGASTVIENCLFEDLSYEFDNNICHGVSLWINGGVARNCLFTNISVDNGGSDEVVYVGANGALENCTIADCRVKYLLTGADGSTARVICVNGAARNLLCCRFEEILGPGGEKPTWEIALIDSAATVENCCFEGTQVFGVDPADGTRICFDEMEPYHLTVRSSCRNRARPLDWMTETAVDLDGNPRIFGRKPDIGCYECQKKLGLVIMLQ